MTTGEHQQHGHGAYDPSNLLRSDAFYGGVYQEIVDWLDISPSVQVLEAGSGAGGFTALLAGAVGSAGGVAALDVTPELLQTAREQLEQSRFQDRVSFHEGDIQRLPFEDGRFDLVWSSRTIHHLPDQLVGVREVARVIKPGSRFALREGGLRPRFLPSDIGIAEPGLEDRLEVAFDQWFQKNVRQGEGVVRYPHGWTQLLKDGGLADVSARTFLLELLPPFSRVQVEFMLNLLRRWVDNEQRTAFISGDDAKVIKRLTDPESPDYAFNRSDLHYVEGVTVYTGQILS
jgi:ubiquinone/menaquinone biosynthesis C-methylase UbiE